MKNALDEFMLKFKAYLFASNDTLSLVHKKFAILRFSVKTVNEINFEKKQIDKNFYFIGKMHNK